MVSKGQIDSYMINYNGGVKTNLSYRVTINLYGPNHKYIGTVYFSPPKYDEPAGSDSISSGGYVRMFYAMDDYLRILDLLRNEKPLYLYYLENVKAGRISTSFEEIGEEETEP